MILNTGERLRPIKIGLKKVAMYFSVPEGPLGKKKSPSSGLKKKAKP